MSTASLSTKVHSIREFESRIHALADEIRIEIMDPFEDEDAIAKIYVTERKLDDAIQDIALDIQDRMDVRIVPLIIYQG